MSEMREYTPGTFSWVDLSTPNTEAAKKFYTALFGWTGRDMPAGEAGTYTMFQFKGKEVAGMGQQDPNQQAQGVPPFWLSYVTVANANESAAKISALGGTVLMGPMDVMDAGRMAVAQDPTGAAFAIWEAGNHIGAQLVNDPGAFGWNELATRDADRAGAFYTSLFNWGTQTQDMGDAPPYTIFKVGERMNGGMMQLSEQFEGAPSNWMVYFSVADCDASAKKVEELGGKIQMPPTDIPATGRFAVVQDPQGAVFAIIKLEAPE
jgi:predicted enzyme related to lactoylglutathione lyase